ncbi:glycosyltransferase [bacterium]|nr:glycosyltransferase [bacterium]
MSCARRVLIVAPGFSAWDLGRHLVEILSGLGHEVSTLSTQAFQKPATVRRALVSACHKNSPDLVFANFLAPLQSVLRRRVETEHPDLLILLALNRVSPETLKSIKVPTVAWYVDCFQEGVPLWLSRRLPYLRAFFCTSRDLAQRLDAHWLVEGARIECFPEPTDPLPSLYSSQVAFVGSIYHPAPDPITAGYRERLLKLVAGRFELKVWGPQGYPMSRQRWGSQPYPVREWPAYNEELVKVCRSSQCVLGVNLFNHIPGYFSNRTYITLAAGGFHLTHYVPGLEGMFDNHRHLVWYRDPEECLELIDHYLQRPEEREVITRQGKAWVTSRYSMEAQVQRLMQVCERTCF